MACELRGIVARCCGVWNKSMSGSIKKATLVRRHSTEESDIPEKKSKCRDIAEDLISESNLEDSKGIEKLRKRKLALLMSYCGAGYYGMQRNHGFDTIEDRLLKALHTSGAIPEEGINRPLAVNFQRAARTDKGVSAARQIVNIRASMIENFTETVNNYLPQEIRVISWKRVTQGFNCKTKCDARTYSYMIPTFAFAPVDSLTNINFRMDERTLEEVNSLLKMFTGTHNFHNFTAGKKSNDASACRYIMEFKCGQPFIREEIEFAVITVKGQSFMLHQIRKMIGATVAIMRGLATSDLLTKAWGSERVDIPIAPGVGLVLEHVHYDYYNKRYGSDGIHEPLTWEEEEDAIQRFKETYIEPHIIKAEKNSLSMLTWLSSLVLHTYDVREDSVPSSVSRINSDLGKAYLNIISAEQEKDHKEKEENSVIE